MIRQPSPMSRLYAWHRAALAGLNPPQHEGLPECGWYQRKMVKGGPWVPVRIFVQRDIDPETCELTGPERLVADVDGTICDPGPHWTHLTPISRGKYHDMLQRRATVPAMAATHAPLDPATLILRP